MREWIEKQKASVRAKVEHPFHIVKNVFAFKKARYRRLAKNTAQLFALFGLANLLIAKRRLFAFTPKVRPEMTNEGETHRLEGLNEKVFPRFEHHSENLG